jgi:DNA-binding FadR family transcriptional regulator
MAEVLGGILRGEYEVGGGLPREVDLAEQHDVSRYVARESIQALRDRGVLTVKHGRGTTIASPAEWNLFDGTLLSALLEGPEGRPTKAEAAETRAIVWPEAAALAARRRTKADLRELEAALDEGEAAFLERLAQAAGNRFVRHVLVSLDRAAPAGKRSPAPVLDAVREGDQDGARAAMAAYLGRR